MNKLYESKITTKRWIVYDIFGNLGWITYFVCTGKIALRGFTGLLVPVLLSAVLMLVGILELISERIAKLDRILPKRRLYCGFGALTLGGICGTAAAAAGCCIASDPLFFWLLGGGVLCAVFGGLLFREYHPV